jgi:hypothetical protein
MTTCYAHSMSSGPEEEWEPLFQHLTEVAELPLSLIGPLGFINQRPRSVKGGKRDYSLPLGTIHFRRPVDGRMRAADGRKKAA